MIFDQETLIFLESLNLKKDPEVGDFFGRGYADFGVEVFCVVPKGFISLMSGTILEKAKAKDFFFIPPYEELLAVLVRNDPEKAISFIRSQDLSYINLLQLTQGILKNEFY
ncbi:MAG: hypothetical protein NZT61_06745 [Deltaproteobacteria bacterium]|nr:hypothetical protein [Deltaproteobacteria bacterium]MCX7952678.1 hypothetical protein [Deltaproteobacteria bacterium]